MVVCANDVVGKEGVGEALQLRRGREMNNRVHTLGRSSQRFDVQATADSMLAGEPLGSEIEAAYVVRAPPAGPKASANQRRLWSPTCMYGTKSHERACSAQIG
jgi:hypothetical protein